MKVKAVRGKTENRYETVEIPSLDIVSYGRENLYPDILANAIQASGRASTCVDRYADFIEGGGFEAEGAGEIVVNMKGETLDDLHEAVCRDIACFNGFALHVSYNVFCQVVNVRHVPFTCCRFCIPDDWGHISRIAVHPDWSGHTYRNRKPVTVTKKNIDYFDIFNPDPAVIRAQIARSGGVENYNGQILYVSLTKHTLYPVGRADSIFTEMLTDAGLANTEYRNVCCNFLPAGMIITRRGAAGDDGPMTELEKDLKGRKAEDFSTTLSNLQGDPNTAKLLEIEIEQEEEKPEFVKLETNNYDSAFTTTADSVARKIYQRFKQEAWYCLSVGKSGFSGSIVKDATEVYNSEVVRERRAVERAFKKIFSRWYKEDDFEKDENGNLNLAVSPYVLIENVSTPAANTNTYEGAQ